MLHDFRKIRHHDGSFRRDSAAVSGPMGACRATRQASAGKIKLAEPQWELPVSHGKLPPSDGSSRWCNGSLPRHSATVAGAREAYRGTRQASAGEIKLAGPRWKLSRRHGKLPPADGSSQWRDGSSQWLNGSLRRHSATVAGARGAYRMTRQASAGEVKLAEPQWKRPVGHGKLPAALGKRICRERSLQRDAVSFRRVHLVTSGWKIA